MSYVIIYSSDLMSPTGTTCKPDKPETSLINTGVTHNPQTERKQQNIKLIYFKLKVSE